MPNLQYRQEKIQAKRKQTPRRDFVMEIASWFPLMFYKDNGKIGRYPNTDRSPKNIVDFNKYFEIANNNINNTFLININYFEAFFDLLKNTTLPLFQNSIENENSIYADIAFGAKNCYLSSVAIAVENILYSYQCKNAKDVHNSIFVQQNSSRVYQSIGILESFNVFYSKHIKNSSDVRFSYELNGCSNCILCYGLSNASYCINNIQYSEVEYQSEKQKILANKKDFEQLYLGLNSDKSLTSFNNYCTNIQNGYYNSGVSNGNNLIFVGDSGDSKSCYDAFSAGMNAYDFYAVAGAGYNSSNIYCSVEVTIGCHNIFYSYFLENCSFCLFCSGLIGQSYCILNKQYTKEEWYEKVDEIFAQMDADGTLGDFFPPSMNPFYFNDTAAYLIDSSFTREEVIAKGYMRRDEPIHVDIPADAQIVKTNELNIYEGYDDDGNWTINLDILKKVIQDDQGNVYRIIKMEYDFLVKHGLPLPRKHRLDRMKDNFRIN